MRNDLSNNSPVRVAVIGGGISGLSAALRLHDLARNGPRNVEITLFERSDRLGGVLRSERIGEYLVEHSADMWITNKPEGVQLCERLGLADRLIPTEARFRRSLVLRGGRVHAVPEGFQLMVPEQAWPLLKSPVLSWRGKLRLLAEAFVPARRDGADESLAEFVRRRCGREAYERLVQPLVGGIYTADPAKLSLLATLPRFIEMERKHGSLIRAALRQRRHRDQGEVSGTSGARYGLFVSLPNGVEELVTALARQVAEFSTIRFHTAVRSVRLRSDGAFEFVIEGRPSETSPAANLAFDAVILAVPAFVAARLLATQESASAVALSELATDLHCIAYASTAVVASGHQLSHIAHPLDAFGLVVPAIERRGVLAVSFASRKFAGRAPDGQVLLRTFVGGALQPELFQLEDAELIKLVRSELRDLLGVTGAPVFELVLRHSQAMPQYHVGHVELIAKIAAEISRCPGLALAGNFLSGVGIPDSIASGEAAAARVWRNDEIQNLNGE